MNDEDLYVWTAVPNSWQGRALGFAPEISIIVPHYNDLGNLRRCIELLAAQSFPSAMFEIVVADNNSPCGLDAVVEACGGRANVILAPIQGAGEARNAGVRAARGRVLAFIDSDCRPTPKWLQHGVEALEIANMVGGAIAIEAADPARFALLFVGVAAVTGWNKMRSKRPSVRGSRKSA